VTGRAGGLRTAAHLRQRTPVIKELKGKEQYLLKEHTSSEPAWYAIEIKGRHVPGQRRGRSFFT